jgi:fumarylacetoacetate (FAA) hydrolase
LKEGGRDGTLVVVSRDLKRAIKVPDIAPTLQYALDHWRQVEPDLQRAYKRLHEMQFDALGGERAFDLALNRLAAPLPRSHQFLDGSAYLRHVELVRRAHGATMTEALFTDPLMHQARSDGFIGPEDDIVALDEVHGIDFEAEVAAIVDDVPMGAPAEMAGTRIRLLMLINDVSLRNVIPGELAKGYGYVNGKLVTACSPVAVTPDELAPYWSGAKVKLPLVTYLNGRLFGNPNAGVDMQFDFATLVAHAARTRPLNPGTIVGSGPVSNKDARVGSSCLAELRTLETLLSGRPSTPFLKFGDRVHIEMLNGEGHSIFGPINQKVVRYGADSAERFAVVRSAVGC